MQRLTSQGPTEHAVLEEYVRGLFDLRKEIDNLTQHLRPDLRLDSIRTAWLMSKDYPYPVAQFPDFYRILADRPLVFLHLLEILCMGNSYTTLEVDTNISGDELIRDDKQK